MDSGEDLFSGGKIACEDAGVARAFRHNYSWDEAVCLPLLAPRLLQFRDECMLSKQLLRAASSVCSQADAFV